MVWNRVQYFSMLDFIQTISDVLQTYISWMVSTYSIYCLRMFQNTNECLTWCSLLKFKLQICICYWLCLPSLETSWVSVALPVLLFYIVSQTLFPSRCCAWRFSRFVKSIIRLSVMRCCLRALLWVKLHSRLQTTPPSVSKHVDFICLTCWCIPRFHCVQSRV